MQLSRVTEIFQCLSGDSIPALSGLIRWEIAELFLYIVTPAGGLEGSIYNI